MRLNNFDYLRFITACTFLFVISFGISFFFINPKHIDGQNNFTPFRTRISNTEVALIFFGCSNCPSAMDERLPGMLGKLSASVSEVSDSLGYEYTLIGLSNEAITEEGINYLSSISEFDEISVGNGMGNTALQKYVWMNFSHPFSAATPQIIIAKRIYDSIDFYGQPVVVPEIVSEEIILRKVGIDEIEQLLTEDRLVEYL